MRLSAPFLAACGLTVLSLTVLSLAAGLSSLAWAEQTLRLTCNDFPPHKIEQPGADGQRGFDVDIITEAFRRAGWSLDITFLPWKRALEFATRPEYDGVCSCSRAPGREETLVFSDEIFAVSVGLFALDPAALEGVTKVAELKDRSVAVVGGYNLEGELDAAGAKVTATSTDKRALDMLLHGNIDLIYAYDLPTRHFMHTRTLIKAIEYREMRRNPYYLCLNRQSTKSAAAMADFNRALAEMKGDSTMKRILRRYRIEYP